MTVHDELRSALDRAVDAELSNWTLKKALQKIADLPPPDKATRPYKRTPQQIAIAALSALSNGEDSHG